MFKTIDNQWTEGEYLKFKDEGYVSPGSKTRKYAVYSTYNSAFLGYVKWFIQWRQYTFWPVGGSVFDKKCLREVAEFCELRTTIHREARKV